MKMSPETLESIEILRQPLLVRLKKVMVRAPGSYDTHAERIGISNVTFKSFLKGKKISLETLQKVEKYVSERESM
jgi:hypothetical protein